MRPALLRVVVLLGSALLACSGKVSPQGSPGQDAGPADGSGSGSGAGSSSGSGSGSGSSSGISSSDAGGSSGGGPCTTAAGALPPPACDDTPESCVAPSPACPTAPCNATSACLAMADNTGQPVQSFRVRKLHVTAPQSLAQQFIQQGIFDEGINLDDSCGEGGNGGYSWLLQLDPNAGRLETGGAPVTSDPFGVGYCFVDATIGVFPVAPVTTSVSQGPDGSWSSAVIPELYVPLFVDGDATSAIVLPLRELTISQVSISPDDNCIGSYDPDGVTAPSTDGTCQDEDPSSCERWHTAGAMGGFITLKEADTVLIPELGKSLCVLLTDGTATTNGGMNCAADASGNITAQGDFCSTTDSPGGCQDSSWFAAAFAASAAKVTSGSSVSWCNGTMAGDGGG